jgi:hypothetical protein
MLERKQPRVLRDPSQRYPSGLGPISSRARWSVFDVNDSSVSTNSIPERAHFARRASISFPCGMKVKSWWVAIGFGSSLSLECRLAQQVRMLCPNEDPFPEPAAASGTVWQGSRG